MDTILRAAATYWFLYFVLIMMGRRAFQQTTMFEFILLFLFGGISIPAIIADDHSLVNAWLGVMTIALNHIFVTLIQRKGKMGSLLAGTPIPVVERGKWFHERISSLRILEQDIMAAARERGIERFDQIDNVIIERNGEISVMRKPTD
jgi:uncharacterized membrane protein YcaP (DUF421 family)